MFWKLLKYEMKCSYRSYLFVYAILLLSALFFQSTDSAMMAFVAILYAIMMFVIVIMTFVMTIKTYHSSMFTKAGYLTLTLPVSSRKLLMVKVINSTFWFLISYFVILASAVLIVWRAGGIDFYTMLESMKVLAQVTTLHDILMIVTMFVSIAQMIIMIYTVMNITHTNYIRKYRNIIAVILFILINVGIEWINQLIFPGFAMNNTVMSITSDMKLTVTNDMVFALIESVVLSVMFFFASCYVLDHKIEIE